MNVIEYFFLSIIRSCTLYDLYSTQYTFAFGDGIVYHYDIMSLSRLTSYNILRFQCHLKLCMSQFLNHFQTKVKVLIFGLFYNKKKRTDLSRQNQNRNSEWKEKPEKPNKVLMCK